MRRFNKLTNVRLCVRACVYVYVGVCRAYMLGYVYIMG